MDASAKYAKNIERYRQAIASHERENPTHTAHGIGLSHFDMERLGHEEGETLWGSITIHADGGQSGNLRVLCDGEHDGDETLAAAEEREYVHAVGEEWES